MVVTIKGKIFKRTQTKTGKMMYGLLVDRPDGMQDSLNLMSTKQYKVGDSVSVNADVFIQFASEAVA